MDQQFNPGSWVFEKPSRRSSVEGIGTGLSCKAWNPCPARYSTRSVGPDLPAHARDKLTISTRDRTVRACELRPEDLAPVPEREWFVSSSIWFAH